MSVSPADCKYTLFRQQYWAAAAWNVEPVECATNRCMTKRHLSSKQAHHLKGMQALDLGSLPKEEAPPSELKARREKFNYFEKHCSEVHENIFLGSEYVAKNREILRSCGVTHVVNCVGFLYTSYFAQELTYKTLYLQDAPSEDLICVLYDVFDFMEAARKEDGHIYVHCSQGVSRSTSIVIAYLMWKLQQPYDEVYTAVKAIRGVANPNIGFTCQLLQWYKRLHEPVLPHQPRIYHIVPQSTWAPLYLVPKALSKPNLKSLDPRGAFVCHSASGVFVWQGSRCPPPLASASETIAQQLVRYENIRHPVQVVTEGAEPAEFLEELAGSADQVPENFEAVEEKNYDAAYKIYEDAFNPKPLVSSVPETPRSNPKTPRDEPDPTAGSPNQRNRKQMRSQQA